MSVSRLPAFIYLLVRDRLPFGTIERTLQDLDGLSEFDLSEGHQADYVTRIADYLTEHDQEALRRAKRSCRHCGKEQGCEPNCPVSITVRSLTSTESDLRTKECCLEEARALLSQVAGELKVPVTRGLVSESEVMEAVERLLEENAKLKELVRRAMAHPDSGLSGADEQTYCFYCEVVTGDGHKDDCPAVLAVGDKI